MSTDLYLRPVIDGKIIMPRDLKYIIAQRFWGHDGSLASDSILLCDSQIDYLNGILDTTDNINVQDAINLIIESIRIYGTVEI